MSRAYVTFGRGPKSPGDMFQKVKFRLTYLRQRPLFLHAILAFVTLAEALVARAHEQPWSSPHTGKRNAKQCAGTTKDNAPMQLDAAKSRKERAP